LATRRRFVAFLPFPPSSLRPLPHSSPSPCREDTPFIPCLVMYPQLCSRAISDTPATCYLPRLGSMSYNPIPLSCSCYPRVAVIYSSHCKQSPSILLSKMLSDCCKIRARLPQDCFKIIARNMAAMQVTSMALLPQGSSNLVLIRVYPTGSSHYRHVCAAFSVVDRRPSRVSFHFFVTFLTHPSTSESALLRIKDVRGIIG
jgi:hypothetical protein